MPGAGPNTQGANGINGSTTQAPAIVPVSAPSSLQAGAHDALPLDEGVLTDNLGVNIVVVLTKVSPRKKQSVHWTEVLTDLALPALSLSLTLLAGSNAIATSRRSNSITSSRSCELSACATAQLCSPPARPGRRLLASCASTSCTASLLPQPVKETTQTALEWPSHMLHPPSRETSSSFHQGGTVGGRSWPCGMGFHRN